MNNRAVNTLVPRLNAVCMLHALLCMGTCFHWEQSGVEFLGYKVCISSTLVDNGKLASRKLCPFTLLLAVCENDWYATSYQYPISSELLILARSHGHEKEGYLIVVGLCISIITNELSIFSCVC